MNLRDGTHENREIFEMQIERKSGSSRPSQTGESPSQLSQFAGVFRASEISIFYERGGRLAYEKVSFLRGFHKRKYSIWGFTGVFLAPYTGSARTEGGFFGAAVLA